MINSKAGNISPQRYSQKVALNEVCRTFGLKQEWIALKLGKVQGTISKWLDPDQPDFPSFDDWNELVRLVKDHTGSIEPIRALCQWHGTDAVALSSQGIGLDPHTLGRLASILARKGGSVLALMIQIIEDGQIDDIEEARLAEASEDIEAYYIALGDLRERAKAARAHAKQQRPA